VQRDGKKKQEASGAGQDNIYLITLCSWEFFNDQPACRQSVFPNTELDMGRL
jgi:hypothetical protein